jgi:putative transposase
MTEGEYHLVYHFVWCSKYRRPVLVGDVEQELQRLLREKAEVLQVGIEALEVGPDSVHLVVSAPPTLAPQGLAKQFKGYTSHHLRQQFAHLRSRLPTLWSLSYYVGSAGSVTEERIRQFIDGQKTRGQH